MRILAIEPYYGGSHKAFLTGWSTRSRHAWTVLDLPAHKWKWRMRHGAITLADRVRAEAQQGGRWDLVFCSDMLNLAEFRGLAVDAVRTLPCVVYFHENQLTYPVRHESERDYHFVLTNMTTALAADRVWFNSAFHRDSFVNGLPGFLRRMPDHQQLDAADRIRVKSDVCYPGIETWPRRAHRQPGPLHIVWAGRWEHDKNPETFFSALDRLRATGTAFRVSVVGEQFRESPPIFDRARTQLSEHIEHWGYQADRHVYEQLLADADVFVSTASQEFFGLSVVEAVAAGCYPLLPRRLAYPELFASAGIEDPEPFFYDGSTEDLAHQLQRLAHRIQTQGCVSPEALAERFTARYGWDTLADTYDEAIEKHRR